MPILLKLKKLQRKEHFQTHSMRPPSAWYQNQRQHKKRKLQTNISSPLRYHWKQECSPWIFEHWLLLSSILLLHFPSYWAPRILLGTPWVEAGGASWEVPCNDGKPDTHLRFSSLLDWVMWFSGHLISVFPEVIRINFLGDCQFLSWRGPGHLWTWSDL